jgi:hypothetical protein
MHDAPSFHLAQLSTCAQFVVAVAQHGNSLYPVTPVVPVSEDAPASIASAAAAAPTPRAYSRRRKAGSAAAPLEATLPSPTAPVSPKRRRLKQPTTSAHTAAAGSSRASRRGAVEDEESCTTVFEIFTTSGTHLKHLDPLIPPTAVICLPQASLVFGNQKGTVSIWQLSLDHTDTLSDNELFSRESFGAVLSLHSVAPNTLTVVFTNGSIVVLDYQQRLIIQIVECVYTLKNGSPPLVAAPFCLQQHIVMSFGVRDHGQKLVAPQDQFRLPKWGMAAQEGANSGRRSSKSALFHASLSRQFHDASGT